jgi:type IV secretion system protein VirB9
MRKLWKLTVLMAFMAAVGTTATAAQASPAAESGGDEVLRYLREQYPHLKIPSSADVIWMDPTGKGAEADIEAALRRGAIVTRDSVSEEGNTKTPEAVREAENTAARKYPRAPDPFRPAVFENAGETENTGSVAGNDEFGEGEFGEFDESDADREVRDARLARHWLDIREDLSLRDIDEKALNLVQDFAKAKHAVPPVSLQNQNGALSYVYGDHIPRIVCRPNHLTDIALQAGEKGTAVHAGDTARWQIAPAKSGTDAGETVHVIVKPLMPDIRTNLLVMTDRRTYNLDLLSSASDFIPSARFSYPDDAANSWSAFIAESRKKQEEKDALSDAYTLSPDDLYFGYEITKGRELPWRPVRVFDDGTKTYIEMPAKYRSLEAPVLMFYEGNQLKLVNYRVKDRFYTADRIMTKKAVLMAGKSRVVIERVKDSKKPGRRPLSASSREEFP